MGIVIIHIYIMDMNYLTGIGVIPRLKDLSGDSAVKKQINIMR